MANREEAIARIRAILAELNCTIIREPEGWAGFVAALPGGEQFFISAYAARYNGPCRIALSSSWGQYQTVSGGGYGRAERGLAQLSSSSYFLGRGEEGLGRTSIDPDRPLATILKDLERRFFKRLRELWPRAEAFPA